MLSRKDLKFRSKLVNYHIKHREIIDKILPPDQVFEFNKLTLSLFNSPAKVLRTTYAERLRCEIIAYFQEIQLRKYEIKHFELQRAKHALKFGNLDLQTIRNTPKGQLLLKTINYYNMRSLERKNINREKLKALDKFINNLTIKYLVNFDYQK